MKSHLGTVKLRGVIPSETFDYFINNNPRTGRFYLLPKLHNRIHKLLGRLVISSCGYYTQNISFFADYLLQPLAKDVMSFIKDSNDVLRHFRDLQYIPGGSILCTIDAVGLYPNIPHNEGVGAIRDALETREDKIISTESIVELAECVIKNNIFEYDNTYFKQKPGTATGTKMPPHMPSYLWKIKFKNAWHINQLCGFSITSIPVLSVPRNMLILR